MSRETHTGPHHHPVTLSLLAKGTQGRLELEHFVAGRRSVQQLPLLQHYAGCFRFVQITERSYEAAHSLIKRRVPPNATGPLISLALRLQDFNLSVKLNADCLWQVAEHFEGARAIPMNTAVGLHPDVVQAMHAKSKWPLIRTLNKVLYRTDTLSQFPEMQRDAARLLAFPQSEAVTYDVLRAKALLFMLTSWQ